MSGFVQNIADAMNGSLGAPLTVFLLSMIPLAEAKGAILFGIGMGLKPWEAFGWAFLGSSMLAPILLLILIPAINALSKTRLFSKVGKFLYAKFERSSRKLADNVKESEDGAPPSSDERTAAKKKRSITKSDLKKMGGTALFVAVPLPLTGVWTGSAVASIVKIGFFKGLIGLVIGNAGACGILTLIGYIFRNNQKALDAITLSFYILAAVILLIVVIKLIIYKPEKPNDNENKDGGPSDGKEQ